MFLHCFLACRAAGLHPPFYICKQWTACNGFLEVSTWDNPRDGGAWWAAVYGVAQSQTRLKWLSSSSSSNSGRCGHCWGFKGSKKKKRIFFIFWGVSVCRNRLRCSIRGRICWVYLQPNPVSRPSCGCEHDLTAPKDTAAGWICSSPNAQHLIMWLYLDVLFFYRGN